MEGSSVVLCDLEASEVLPSEVAERTKEVSPLPSARVHDDEFCLFLYSERKSFEGG